VLSEPADLTRRVRTVSDAGLPVVDLDADTLVGHATLALELTEHFAGRPKAFDDFVASQGIGFEEWMWNLPNALAGAGMVDEAIAVADAFGGLDTANESQYTSDAVCILARAGRTEEARGRLGATVERWPDSPWVRIQAGEALVAAGDPEAAKSQFVGAVELAEQQDDPGAVDTAYQYLIGFLAERPGGENDAEAARKDLQAWQERTGWISVAAVTSPFRAGTKIGRNQPCPCGSGRKYKHCCGRKPQA
jgi:thioredoxin-like negative regulator of GroEL